MTMHDGAACPHHSHAAGHAVDKAGCGACCGPVAATRVALDVLPVTARVAALPRRAATAAPPQFLTGGPERPPRSDLA